MNGKLTLFLDFDGVLHPDSAGADVEFVHVERFESVLREFPCIQVVVSSDWRLELPLETIRLKFSVDIRPRIVGVTPSIPEIADQRGQRQRECELWLSRNVRNESFVRWIALDDREPYFDRGCQNLLLLPRSGYGGVGLVGEQVERLRQHIRKFMGL